MKKILIILLVIFFSCSNDDNDDCINEKQKVIEQFDELIQLALDSGDLEQAQTLTRNKEIRLSEFDC